MNFSQPAPATEWRTKVAHGETVGFDPKINKAPDGAKEKIRELFFCRPIWGLLHFVILPTVSPWATFYRASGAFAALVLFFAVGATAETTNTLSDAEIQGRQLAQQLCDSPPEENSTNIGILQIRNVKGKHTEIPVKFAVIITETNWTSIFEGINTNLASGEMLRIIHQESQPNQYAVAHVCQTGITFSNLDIWGVQALSENGLTMPFANSDFWLTDLGLEFFYWPEQKVLPKTTNLKRGREYTLLESTNRHPSTNGYSRVLTCIDKETGGILEAEAYDTKGELLKVFEPKSFKKVNGQWQLQEMEIRNVQTGSRTRLEFDVNK
jgi:Outer membrane lipoprotein-sorting protein